MRDSHSAMKVECVKTISGREVNISSEVEIVMETSSIRGEKVNIVTYKISRNVDILVMPKTNG